MPSFITEQPYAVLFFALLFGGETILVPAIYLALLGKLNLWGLAAVASVATMLSDSGWYLAGRILPAEKVGRIRWLGKRWPQMFSYASGLFKRHGLKAIFFSKFIYGTRIAAQMLAGVARLAYYRYIIINLVGVIAWLGFIVGIGLLVGHGADRMGVQVHRAYLLLGCFIPAVLFGRVVMKHLMSRFLAIPTPASPGLEPKTPSRVVSAIVPAFNEQDTVADVVRVLETHPAIDDIIVVDDGSMDGTAERARETSAMVVRLGSNQGKAAAMAKGVELSRHETIFFLDADLRGLTHEVIDGLVQPVLSGAFDMFVAIRDRRQSLLNKIVYFSPILGGERVLSKTLWRQAPSWCVKSFQIEIALNYFSKRSGSKMGWALMPGLRHIKKETKRGFWPGVFARVRMYSELVAISFKLYVVHAIGSLFWGRFIGRPLRQPLCPRS
jgi:membrane protein DedA with SNARE-associated domain